MPGFRGELGRPSSRYENRATRKRHLASRGSTSRKGGSIKPCGEARVPAERRDDGVCVCVRSARAEEARGVLWRRAELRAEPHAAQQQAQRCRPQLCRCCEGTLRGRAALVPWRTLGLSRAREEQLGMFKRHGRELCK